MTFSQQACGHNRHFFSKGSHNPLLKLFFTEFRRVRDEMLRLLEKHRPAEYFEDPNIINHALESSNGECGVKNEKNEKNGDANELKNVERADSGIIRKPADKDV